MNRLAPVLAAALIAGCVRALPVLEPAGPFAQRLADIVLVFTAVCAAVWLLVMVALALALARRKPTADEPVTAPDRRSERRLHWAIGIAVALSVLILIGLNLGSFYTDRRLHFSGEPALTIVVTGRQWWWQVRYEDPQPQRVLTGANEIHIPVGEPVKLKLRSADVIHSFWVPELAGKRDLIPGRENELVIQADRPGDYHGQCAEFCGFQHAHMRLLVVAQPRAAFEAWREQQLRPAAPPADPQRARGLQVFLSQPCLMCHTVRGTPAAGKVAPDLTHIASQRTLAAGTLVNSRGNLAAWIADPQGIKPGAKMPSMQIPPQDLHPLLDYLQGLE